MNEKKDTVRKTTPCPGCGGSGLTSFFAGESRFMLTREDCPDCAGTLLLAENEEPRNRTGDEGEP